MTAWKLYLENISYTQRENGQSLFVQVCQNADTLFYSRLMCYSLHNPHKGVNIFEIVELFKKEQALTEIEIRQLMAGGTRRRQAPRRRNQVESKPL